MRLKCPCCKETMYRDMRLKMNKANLTRKGLRSFCSIKGEYVFLKLAIQAWNKRVGDDETNT